MKTIIIMVIGLVALGGTWGIAQELKKDGRSGMSGMMKDMMQESKPDDGSSRMMHHMGGVMGMIKMMEQCNEMMKSGHHHNEKTKDSSQK